MAKRRLSLKDLPKQVTAVVADLTARSGVEDIVDRLRELGFMEGSKIQVLHRGASAGGPLAVKVDQITLAMRQSEANCVLVELPD